MQFLFIFWPTDVLYESFVSRSVLCS